MLKPRKNSYKIMETKLYWLRNFTNRLLRMRALGGHTSHASLTGYSLLPLLYPDPQETNLLSSPQLTLPRSMYIPSYCLSIGPTLCNWLSRGLASGLSKNSTHCPQVYDLAIVWRQLPEYFSVSTLKYRKAVMVCLCLAQGVALLWGIAPLE